MLGSWLRPEHFGFGHPLASMGKLGELSKFLEYFGNMLEISSQLIWNIQVTYWKFPVGSKMKMVVFDI